MLLAPVRLSIRVANPHIEECQALGIPEASCPNVQSCILCSVGPSNELFFHDVLENWLDLDVTTHYTQKIDFEVSQLITVLDYKPPRLQIIVWSTVKFPPHAHTDGMANHDSA